MSVARILLFHLNKCKICWSLWSKTIKLYAREDINSHLSAKFCCIILRLGAVHDLMQFWAFLDTPPPHHALSLLDWPPPATPIIYVQHMLKKIQNRYTISGSHLQKNKTALYQWACHVVIFGLTPSPHHTMSLLANPTPRRPPPTLSAWCNLWTAPYRNINVPSILNLSQHSAPMHTNDSLIYYLAGNEINHFWDFWGEFL